MFTSRKKNSRELKVFKIFVSNHGQRASNLSSELLTPSRKLLRLEPSFIKSLISEASQLHFRFVFLL